MASTPNASSSEKWIRQLRAAWAAHDADGAQELMESPEATPGAMDVEEWAALGQDAFNASIAPLMDIARAQMPSERVQWMNSGISEGYWAILNGRLFGASTQEDDEFHQAIAERAPIDMPMASPDCEPAGGVPAECVAGRWRPMHAAAWHNKPGLIELYAKNGHSPDGWWDGGATPPAPPREAGGGFRSGADAPMWSSGYVVPGQTTRGGGSQWSFGPEAIERRGYAGEMPDSTPLLIACKKGHWDAAQALVQHGARGAFGRDAERPANWRAGEWMAKHALSPIIESGQASSRPEAEARSLDWARLALRTLAPQGDEAANQAAIGASTAPAAILALARTAREALVISAKATNQAAKHSVKEGELKAARGVSRLLPKHPGFLSFLWASRAEQLDRDFWLALGLRDAVRMGEWAQAAKKAQTRREKSAASQSQSIRVNGLPPVAWITALALAEEVRARKENKTAAMFWRGALGAGSAAALFAEISRHWGAECLSEPVGVWGGLTPAQISAVCDAPGACRTLLALGAESNARSLQKTPLSGSLLEAASRGLSVECNAVAIADSQLAEKDPLAMVAVAVWAAADLPEQAHETLEAASRSQRQEFGALHAVSLAALRNATSAALGEEGANAAKMAALSAKEGLKRKEDWRKLDALAESLQLAAEMKQSPASNPSGALGAKKPDTDAADRQSGGMPIDAGRGPRGAKRL